eukprot:TCALIF_13762-PA protein Name:"Protein of unknown function" AED:0.44 eAED:0.45 QI:0/0/0/0.12/1/1/8/0/574
MHKTAVGKSNEKWDQCGVDKLFDGKKTADSTGYNYYCSWPNKEPWLQIDLTQEASIRSVTIHPRLKYETRITDIQVYIGNNAIENFAKNKLCGTTDSVMDKGVKTVTCKNGPVKGRYVQFKREGVMDITELEFEFGCNDPLCVGVECDKTAVGKSNEKWDQCGVDKLFDGKKTADSTGYNYYCSWPNKEPWLQIDLTQEASIRSVTIHPRLKYETRITDIQVYIGNNAIENFAKNKLCGTTDSVMDKGVKTVTCKNGPVKGRYVQFKREGVMDITELEFEFGCNDPLCVGVECDKTAVGKSNEKWDQCGVDKLFDGKKTADSTGYNYYCSWPNKEPWLQIDLTQEASIRSVTIHPRLKYETRITDIQVYIGNNAIENFAKNKLCGTTDSVMDKGVKTVTCKNGPVKGRYVQFKREGVMDITELEFEFGCNDPLCVGVECDKTAVGKSNEKWDQCGVDKLFDGKKTADSTGYNYYCSWPNKEPWLQIDLTQEASIRSVTIHPRLKYETRITDIQVYIGNNEIENFAKNKLCGTTDSVMDKGVKTVTCKNGPIKGRYVQFKREGVMDITELEFGFG